jgi:hypothetical protein
MEKDRGSNLDAISRNMYNNKLTLAAIIQHDYKQGKATSYNQFRYNRQLHIY